MRRAVHSARIVGNGVDRSTGGAAVLNKRKRSARREYVVGAEPFFLLEKMLGGTGSRRERFSQEKRYVRMLVEVFRAEVFLSFTKCVREWAFLDRSHVPVGDIRVVSVELGAISGGSCPILNDYDLDLNIVRILSI